jgi:nickel transport protein
MEGSCAVLSFYFPDEKPFSYESYEVLREGERVPFQSGRSDALGRVVFCPDRRGLWTVRVFSEDGHGAEVRLRFDGSSLKDKRSIFERYEKVFVGVALIFGIFGLLELFVRRWRG